MPARVDQIIDQTQIKALGKAGFVVVPRTCVAPQLLGKAAKIDTGLPEADLELACIRQATAERAGMSVRDLIGPALQRRFSMPRQIAMFIAAEHYSKPLTKIATSLGRRDDGAIRQGIGRIRSALRNPASAEATLEKVEWISARATVLIREARAK